MLLSRMGEDGGGGELHRVGGPVQEVIVSNSSAAANAVG